MASPVEAATAARSAQLAAAARDGDLAAIERLADPGFWERAGAEDWSAMLPGIESVEELGVFARRSLVWLRPGSVVELLWAERGVDLVMEDERRFTLLDHEAVLASGDEERLARVATKMRAEQAARRYVQALNDGDEAAAGSFYEPAFAQTADPDLHVRLPSVRSAALIGSVGPRTLVLVEYPDQRLTYEYLWRERDGAMAIAGARVFRPVA